MIRDNRSGWKSRIGLALCISKKWEKAGCGLTSRQVFIQPSKTENIAPIILPVPIAEDHYDMNRLEREMEELLAVTEP